MEIVSTIGPATFNSAMIRMLWCAGVTIFRLNLSHTQDIMEVDRFFDIVHNETKGKTCLDTHGRKFCAPDFSCPNFTAFDVKVVKKYGEHSDYIAVSFAQSPEAIKQAGYLGHCKTIIAKIENRTGYNNKEEIINEADIVLIDRGDLSRTVPLEETPKYCREIIKSCKALNTPVWIATNLLESMVSCGHPTLGEINDIANLIGQGVDGLVLAAETAIGKHPIQCVEFVRKMIDTYA